MNGRKNVSVGLARFILNHENMTKRQKRLLEAEGVAAQLVERINAEGVNALISELRSGITLDPTDCPIGQLSQKRFQTLTTILKVYSEDRNTLVQQRA